MTVREGTGDGEMSEASAPRAEFCRRCGRATTPHRPTGEPHYPATCGTCGHTEYDGPTLVVACPLYEGNRLLWIRRATAPYRGRWTVPSGFVERGETVVEAACREVLEETRIRVDPEQLRLFTVLSLPAMNQLYIGLAAPLPDHSFGPTDEALEVALFAREEVASLEMGYPAAALPLVMSGYDAIARGPSRHRPRHFVLRGRDPAA